MTAYTLQRYDQICGTVDVADGVATVHLSGDVDGQVEQTFRVPESHLLAAVDAIPGAELVPT